jgi:hypothetical protein
MVRKRVVARTVYCCFLSLRYAAAPFCRFAMLLLFLSIRCAARRPPPLHAQKKRRTPGTPGLRRKEGSFYFRDGTTASHTLLRVNGPQESGCADIKNRLTRCGLKRPREQNAYRRITSRPNGTFRCCPYHLCHLSLRFLKL